MKKNILYCLLFVFLVCLSGCATGQLSWTSEQRQAITTRTYNFSYEKVFDAILNRFKNNGAPLENIDRQDGIIVTGYTSLGERQYGSGKMKLSVNIIKIEDDVTKVSLYFHCEGAYGIFGIAVTDDLIDERHYEDWFDSLKIQ